MKVYSPHAQRALELHVAEDGDVLARRRIVQIEGMQIAGLSSADILVQQAMHLLKHLCGEHTRLSWVLEFRNHVQARQTDAVFWKAVSSLATGIPNGNTAMGVAMWLAECLFGAKPLPHCHPWSGNLLPGGVELWLTRYTHRVLLSDTVGSKYYVLLRNEVTGSSGEKVRMRRLLLPLRLPASITRPAPNESIGDRSRRYALDMWYFFIRLRFHLVEGMRFAVEVLSWKRALARLRNDATADYQTASRTMKRACLAAVMATAGLSTLTPWIHAQTPTTSGNPASAARQIAPNGGILGEHSSAWYEHDARSTRCAGGVSAGAEKIQGSSVLFRNLPAIEQMAASNTVACLAAGL
jgi:hypothetical protein